MREESHPQAAPVPPSAAAGQACVGSGNEGREAGGLPQRPLLPIDEVLILIALHLILNGGLQVPDALECQF